MTNRHSFPIKDIDNFRQKALEWAAQFPLCAVLDSCQYTQDKYHRYDLLIGVAEEITLQASPHRSSFDQIKQWHLQHQDWLFGYLAYDLKNEIENLSSHNKDTFLLPDMLFFRPLYVLAICRGKLHIYSRTALSPQTLLSKIADTSVTKKEKETIAANIQAAMPRNYYLQSVEAIRNHIIDGDIYEMNFCQEFFVENFTVDPLLLHRRLLKKSKAPFSAFFRQRDIYLSCASPERFLQKQGRQLISQPIKGTIARGTNSTEDKKLQTQLYHSEKDRAENVMIVDLVRNDLARSSIPGTVKVDELFGIYPFAHVSHLISTVTATLRDEVHFAEALQNAFPMGSMTGAPKVMSMQLIEQYEKSKRGLYSGALGYITPDGDFDFNVVIRSILYHTTKKYLSFQVGGAIVYDSFPEKEYEECLLKAKAMLEVTTSPLNGA